VQTKKIVNDGFNTVLKQDESLGNIHKHISIANNISQIIQLFKGLNGVDVPKGIDPNSYPNEHELNLTIENYIKGLGNEKPQLTDEEKQFLQLYTGRGQAFDKTDISISADAGLYEFYTPDYIRERMWKLAYYYGYDGGNVLEPSCATGHMLNNAPSGAKCVGFEVNPITAKIAELCLPNATIYNQYFETAFLEENRGYYRSALKKRLTWLNEYPFSLVIGNPPYGKFQTNYPYFKKPLGGKFMQIEIFFLFKCLELCKPGGLVIFLTASSWLRNGNLYQPMKDEVCKIATFVDAYRTGEVFKHSGIPTDILIYRKK
jgi:type I restriction-modification system DNA methylase subunit